MTRPALPVIFSKAAAEQIDAATRWWRQNRPSSPEAVTEELDGVLLLIQSQPACGRPVARARAGAVRRLYLSKIGYYLYYRSRGTAGVEILAFWHARRGSRPPLKSG